MIDLLNQAVGLIFGGSIVLALMAFIHKRDAVDWEQLARVYGRAWQTPRLHKRFANLILYSEGRPAKSYKGILSIGLLDEGVALRPNPILAPFQPAIFIPYTDIQGWKQDWYLDARSTELSLRKAPHMRLIMPRDQVEWMLCLAAGAAQISLSRPPHGTRPWLTHLLAVLSGVMALVLVVIVIVTVLPAA